MNMNIINIVKALFTLALMINQTSAQENRKCSCSPPTYKFKLDFSKGFSGACPNILEPDKGGVQISGCLFDTSPNGVPEKLIEIQFINLDEFGSAIKSETQSGLNLGSGEFIEFASLADVITGGIQGRLEILNTNSDKFTLNFFIAFTNACEKLPFSVGNSLGFFVFVSSSIMMLTLYCASKKKMVTLIHNFHNLSIIRRRLSNPKQNFVTLHLSHQLHFLPSLFTQLHFHRYKLLLVHQRYQQENLQKTRQCHHRNVRVKAKTNSAIVHLLMAKADQKVQWVTTEKEATRRKATKAKR